MADVKHSILSDPYLHEPKGISSATQDESYIADGAGAGAWKELYTFGVEDYADAATTSSPIALTSGAKTKLTNDSLGTNTNVAYRAPGKGAIWDASANQFDFVAAGLSLGDTVDIRFDLTINSSAANDAFRLIATPGFGASPYDLVLDYVEYKAAGAYEWIVQASIYMGNSNTLDNPMEVYVKADSASDTVVVNGWYVRPMYRKGLWV